MNILPWIYIALAFAAVKPAAKDRFTCPTGTACKVRECEVEKTKPERVERIRPLIVRYRLEPQANMVFSVADAQLRYEKGMIGEGDLAYTEEKEDFVLRTALTEKGSQLVSDLKKNSADISFMALIFSDDKNAKLTLLEKNFRGDHVLAEVKCKHRELQ